MGLDQYLMKTDSNGDEHEVLYWRKFNALHNWFDNRFNGIENCVSYVVTADDFKDLLADTKTTIKSCFPATITYSTGIDMIQSDLVSGGIICKTKTIDRLSDNLGEFTKQVRAILDDDIEDIKVSDNETRLEPLGGFFFGSTQKDYWYLHDLCKLYFDITDLTSGDYDPSCVYSYYAWW